LLLLRKGGQTVYFGNLGTNAENVIRYFEQGGGRCIKDSENPAEYMLEVIGAGATVTSAVDWHTVWKGSQERKAIQEEMEELHEQGRARPPVRGKCILHYASVACELTVLIASFHSEFATPWMYQLGVLLRRNAEEYWRSPTYLLAKLLLNIVGSLFIGFTFWQSKDTQIGTQNKVFVSQSSYTSLCVSSNNTSFFLRQSLWRRS
jgi:ATP-binding cassette subfamily G (WHITE) protein 2 (SNQ2)